jgi:hypothetical protein
LVRSANILKHSLAINSVCITDQSKFMRNKIVTTDMTLEMHENESHSPWKMSPSSPPSSSLAAPPLHFPLPDSIGKVRRGTHSQPTTPTLLSSTSSFPYPLYLSPHSDFPNEISISQTLNPPINPPIHFYYNLYINFRRGVALSVIPLYIHHDHLMHSSLSHQEDGRE